MPYELCTVTAVTVMEHSLVGKTTRSSLQIGRMSTTYEYLYFTMFEEKS